MKKKLARLIPLAGVTTLGILGALYQHWLDGVNCLGGNADACSRYFGM